MSFSLSENTKFDVGHVDPLRELTALPRDLLALQQGDGGEGRTSVL